MRRSTLSVRNFLDIDRIENRTFLFSSSSKFDSRCGWPAFSSSISQSVRREQDIDGHRTEILCTNCDGHLG